MYFHALILILDRRDFHVRRSQLHISFYHVAALSISLLSLLGTGAHVLTQSVSLFKQSGCLDERDGANQMLGIGSL